MNMDRLILANDFKNHCNKINNCPVLLESIQDSIKRSFMTSGIGTFGTEELQYYNPTRLGDIEVVNNRSLQAASIYGKGKKTAVLNFASARHPGGLVIQGANAQEESLCRCSTLYQVISDKKFRPYYETYATTPNFMPYYTNKLIYSPDIYVTEIDELFTEPLPVELWYKCDIITCAAPNMIYDVRKGIIDKDRLFDVLVERIDNIVNSAIINDVEVLILGAFGCGVFKNPPYIVAKAFKTVLIDMNKANYFDKIIFAIIDDHRGNNNFAIFKKTFQDV